jgi:hypothetical protein
MPWFHLNNQKAAAAQNSARPNAHGTDQHLIDAM